MIKTLLKLILSLLLGSKKDDDLTLENIALRKQMLDLPILKKSFNDLAMRMQTPFNEGNELNR